MKPDKEIEKLRARLEEAESTLDAIRNGGVDALIVNGSEGSKVYTLQGADYGYQVMIENMKDGAVTLSQQGQILYANPAFADLVGVPLEQVIGTALSDFIPAQDEARLQKLLSTGQQGVARAQLVLRSNTAEEVPVQATFNALPNGSSPNLCVILADLRESFRQAETLRHREEELHQARKMEAIGRLAGGVAHDFNNLIAGILGIGSELRSAMPEDDPKRADIEEIIKASQRAFGVTKQLLAFGRRQVVQVRVLNVDHVIQDLTRMLGRMIREDIHLAVELGGAGNICIDPTHLEQVVVNLVLNARDAMPMGGRLTIRTRQEELAKDRPGDLPRGSYAVLEVVDNGIGMSDETKTQIFEPFFTTKAKEQGTGLGLSTVYGIVKQNKGDIRVESSSGAGSRFSIYFPTVSQAQESPRDPVGANAEFRKGTILVVEDEDIVRYVVVRALRRSGYTVLEARHGSEALEHSVQTATPIDLILTDVILAGMNGKQIVEAVQQQHPAARVLFMSGYPQDVISNKGILQNGVSFLEKTDLQSQLLPRIQELLSQTPQPIPSK